MVFRHIRCCIIYIPISVVKEGLFPHSLATRECGQTCRILVCMIGKEYFSVV